MFASLFSSLGFGQRRAEADTGRDEPVTLAVTAATTSTSSSSSSSSSAAASASSTSASQAQKFEKQAQSLSSDEYAKEWMIKMDTVLMYWYRLACEEAEEEQLILPMEISGLIALFLPMFRWNPDMIGPKYEMLTDYSLICRHGFGLACLEGYHTDAETSYEVSVSVTEMRQCCIYFGYAIGADSFKNLDTWPSASMGNRLNFIHFYNDDTQLGHWRDNSGHPTKFDRGSVPSSVSIRNGIKLTMRMELQSEEKPIIEFFMDDVSLGRKFTHSSDFPNDTGEVVPFVGCSVTNGAAKFSLVN